MNCHLCDKNISNGEKVFKIRVLESTVGSDEKETFPANGHLDICSSCWKLIDQYIDKVANL